MSLQPVYQWLETTSLSQRLQASTYFFPVTEVFHLIGLAILLGAASIVCLRLLGFGLQQPASEVYHGMWAWTWFGLILVWGTGIVLMIAEPIKLMSNAAFPYKLTFLFSGLALHFFGYLFLLKPGRAETFPLLAKAVAILILICWFGAGIAGRAIGFV
jgi:hypothetical protein